jgi:uncharacterized membrane protein
MMTQTIEQKPTAQRLWILILSLIGLGVALYLVYIKLFPASPFCMGVGDCEAVNTSIYSEVLGIPIAVFGALAYAVIFLIALLEPRIALLGEWGPVAEFGIAFAGMLYSAYLTYIELYVIHKICPYCVTSAVLITLLTLISAPRAWKALRL